MAHASILSHLTEVIDIHPVGPLADLQKSYLYKRPTEMRDGRLFDVISGHPMSTEFAISRFLTPYLRRAARRIPAAEAGGLALFMDCDVLVRDDLAKLFASVDPDKAVSVVKHQYTPKGETKMDGQAQSAYARKNWSSVMVFNCDHPKVQRLGPDAVNEMTGRELHGFAWLNDDDIGTLDPRWNWLVGYGDPTIDPSVVHFTDGHPDMPGYEHVPFASEWRRVLHEATMRDGIISAA